MIDSQGIVIIAVIIGLVVLGAIVMTLVAKGTLQLIKTPLEGRIAARYQPDEIVMKDLTANSFGLESAGVWQARGNGGLILTEKALHFFMFLPSKEVRVPLDAITELTLTKKHLGKATIYNLLKVHFSVDGKMDSIAWYLADPQAWKAQIEALKAKGSMY